MVSVSFTTFPGLPGSVAAARRFVTGAIRLCPETSVPDDVVDRAELITSELTTNALRHTRSGDPGETFTVQVRVDPCGILGEIHTGRPRLLYSVPHVVEAKPLAESGRGLLLVEQLATRWGSLAPWREGVYFLLQWSDDQRPDPFGPHSDAVGL